MPGFQQKITKHPKKQKPQFEKTDQATEPESDMAEHLNYQNKNLFKMMINVLRALIEKVGSMQEPLGM